MSKQAMGWSCALMVFIGLGGLDSITAQEKKLPNITSPRHSVEAAKQRINAVLDQRLKTPLSYEDEKLDTVFGAVADEYSIPIVLDRAALEDASISPETEVTVDLQNISLRSALKLMLRTPGSEDLTFVIHHEVLLITTQEREAEMMVVRVYNIDQLDNTFQRRTQPGSGVDCYSAVWDVITRCVYPESWHENGTGEGQIKPLAPGMLVVMNTERVHREIEQLLTSLRQTKNEIEQNASSRSPESTTGLVESRDENGS